MKYRVAALSVLLLALGAALPFGASAGKPVPIEPTIALNQSDPHLGGEVTFTTTYSSKIRYPTVGVRCYGSDGSMLYGEAGSAGNTFLLGGASSKWLELGGPASCTAELFYYVWNGNNPQEYYSLAWTSFEAGG